MFMQLIAAYLREEQFGKNQRWDGISATSMLCFMLSAWGHHLAVVFVTLIRILCRLKASVLGIWYIGFIIAKTNTLV